MSQLNVRINHKYDTFANWMGSNLVLNKGEIAIAEIPTETSASGLTPPAIGIKVGDGAKTFAQLNWIQATAGDVYGWAKKESLDYADISEEFKEELKALVNGEIQDTNTTYEFSLAGDVLTINHKEKTDSEFTKLIDITLPFSTKMDKDTDAVEGNLAQFDANGNAVDAGEKIGDFLKKADAESTYAKQADHEQLAEDVSGIAERVGTAEGEIDTLQDQMTALIGADVPAEGETQKSIRTIANEELAKQLIPENAKESMDTLSELAAWLQEHPEDAAAMNEQIGKNKAAHEQNAQDIAKNAEDIGKNAQAAADNKAAIDKLNGADTEEGSVAKAVKDAKDALEQQIGAVDDKADKNAEDIAAIQETLNGKEGTPGVLADIAQLQEDLSALDGEAIKEIDGITATVAGNKATVTAVPVTLLNNVEGDTLVFNCGTASTVI